MKVKLRQTQRVAAEVDVEFPVYRSGDYSGDTYQSSGFYRYEESGVVWHIGCCENIDGRVEWEIERSRWRAEHPYPHAEFDTFEPLDDANSNATEFQAALSKALDFIQGIFK